MYREALRKEIVSPPKLLDELKRLGLAKEYVAYLEDEIAKLKESNELKKEYLKKVVSRHDK